MLIHGSQSFTALITCVILQDTLGIEKNVQNMNIYVQSETFGSVVTSESLASNTSGTIMSEQVEQDTNTLVGSVQRTSVTINEAVLKVQEELPVVAGILMGLTFGLMCSIVLSCKRLGGYAFLSSQVSDFCIFINLLHGLFIAGACAYLYNTMLESQLVQTVSDTEETLFGKGVACGAQIVRDAEI